MSINMDLTIQWQGEKDSNRYRIKSQRDQCESSDARSIDINICVLLGENIY